MNLFLLTMVSAPLNVIYAVDTSQTTSVSDALRNCGIINEAVIKAFKLKGSDWIAGVNLREEWRRFQKENTWIRVHTGAAHEYMIRFLPSQRFQIWQGDASGFSIREWMKMQVPDREVMQHRGKVYSSVFRRHLQHFQYPASRNLTASINDCSRSEFPRFIVEQYLTSRERYGGGKILNDARIDEFFHIPCAIGGGVSVMNGNQTIIVYH